MTPARWKRIDRLFQAALARDPSRQPAFLAAECAGDAELQREVDSLLAAHRSARSFLALPGPGVSPSAAYTGPADYPGGRQEVDQPRAEDAYLQPDTCLAGRYRVGRFLARGGMGEVYAADDLELGVPVALKTLRPELAADPRALRRFRQEVLLARSVVHPRVCRVFDLGRHVDERKDRGDVVFFTMELLEGETLSARIRRRERLPPAEALPIALQMAEALEGAHRAGIVHLDFKSGNVMLVSGAGGERVVVLDFGLAHAVAGAMPGPGARLMGTPAYMAPEQVLGGAVGPAADLYAFGVVLFEMVTGRLPFLAETGLRTATLRLERDPPSPQSFADVEPAWADAILCLLRREPAERFASAADAARALAGGSAASSPRQTLPAECDAFIGRAEELRELDRRIGGGARLVTIAGPPGTGKTRLARHYGGTRAGRRAGGVWFADLSEVRDREGILSALALGLDRGQGEQVTAARLGELIALRGATLVIVDNFEQLVEHAAATLLPLLERAPEAVFLVTSRERLHLPGEEVLALEAMEVDGAGVELFAVRARAQRQDFELTAANREDVREVVRLVDGLPLAIELAAARVRVLAPAALRARLGDRFRTLPAEGPGESRHRTLRATIDWSWGLLRPWERGALAQATVFQGGFSLEAAEAVLDLSAWPQAPGVIDVLQALVDKSLIRTWVPKRSRDLRFGMYLSIQQYAGEKLEAEPPAAGRTARAAAEVRHGTHFADLGSDDAVLARRRTPAGRGALALELENLVAACRRAIGRKDAAAAVAAYRASAEVIDLQGPLATAAELGRGVLALETLAPAEEALAARTLALSCLGMGQVDEARRRFDVAREIYRRTGDRHGEAIVLNNAGNVDYERGALDAALAAYDAARAIWHDLGDRAWEGVALGNAGTAHLERGDIAAARRCFDEALALHREANDRRSEGIVLGNLGNLCLSQGQLDEAHRFLAGALALHREIGNRLFEGLALTNLGIVHTEQGRPAAARECLAAAIVLHREAGHTWEASALGAIAVLDALDGRFAEAREHIERGESILRGAADRVDRCKLLADRGEVERLLGEASRAAATLAEAESLASELGVGPGSEIGLRLARLRRRLAPGDSGSGTPVPRDGEPG